MVAAVFGEVEVQTTLRLCRVRKVGYLRVSACRERVVGSTHTVFGGNKSSIVQRTVGTVQSMKGL